MEQGVDGDQRRPYRILHGKDDIVGISQNCPRNARLVEPSGTTFGRSSFCLGINWLVI
jgi:hypothetical protein